MTNDEFILGLINIGVQKGYNTPDKNTGTKYLDRGKFSFLYNGDIIELERNNSNWADTPKKYFFTTNTKETFTERQIYYISEKTYEKARKYFYSSDYEKLKKKLEKDIRKEKIKNLNG